MSNINVYSQNRNEYVFVHAKLEIISIYIVNGRIVGFVFVDRGRQMSETAKTILWFHVVNGYQHVHAIILVSRSR